MILSFIDIRKVPREGYKPGLRPRFSTLPSGPCELVNEWKIMFDHSHGQINPHFYYMKLGCKVSTLHVHVSMIELTFHRRMFHV